MKSKKNGKRNSKLGNKPNIGEKIGARLKSLLAVQACRTRKLTRRRRVVVVYAIEAKAI